MIDSVSGLANLAAHMSMQQTALDTSVTVLNKIQDQQEAQGEAMLELIASVPVAENSVDVYV